MRIANLLAVLLLPACAIAAPVSLQDGAVTFHTPDGFTALSRAEAEQIFNRGNVPLASYANAERSVSIAVSFFGRAAEPDDLPKLKTEMEAMLSGQPDIKLLESELTVVNDTRWVHFEFTSLQAGTPAHNHVYIAPFRGELLGISFNSKSAAHATHEQALEKSFRSIRLEQ